MVPRRAVLAAAVGLGPSLGGCLTDVGLAKTGYLQFKIVQVEWHHNGTRYQDEILYAAYDGETRPWCRVAEEYRSLAESVADVRVTDDLADELTATFDDARYVTGSAGMAASVATRQRRVRSSTASSSATVPRAPSTIRASTSSTCTRTHKRPSTAGRK